MTHLPPDPDRPDTEPSASPTGAAPPAAPESPDATTPGAAGSAPSWPAAEAPTTEWRVDGPATAPAAPAVWPADPVAGAEVPVSAGPSSPWPETPPGRRAPAAGPTPRWVTPLVVLAALALFAGGVLTGRALVDDEAPPRVVTVADDDDADDVPAADLPAPEGPVDDDVAEPVAAVAAAVAPSVVQLETGIGLGSGVVYDDQGHVLTAAHVVEGVGELTVRLPDGTRVDGRVVGTDPATDVGVVEIDPTGLDLRPAVLAVDVPVEVGQLAVAVGSPFGLEQTVTSGIVSAVDRAVVTNGGVVGMVQTDASINPGNSGGALADRQGRVIGINDAIRTTGGGNEGVGFAIPVGLAVDVAERLIAGEPVQAGFLGVSGTNPTTGPAGALVTEVVPGSPAADAGLREGDLVTAVDGEPIRQMSDLAARIRARQPGERVSVEVQREDQLLRLEVVLATASS
jgi:S1-C subfamily serine protease